MLSSGGTGPIEAMAGGTVESSTSLLLNFDRKTDPAWRDSPLHHFQGWKDEGQDFYATTSTGINLGQVSASSKDRHGPEPGVHPGDGGRAQDLHRRRRASFSIHSRHGLRDHRHHEPLVFVGAILCRPVRGLRAPADRPRAASPLKTNTLTLESPIPSGVAVGMRVSGPGIVPGRDGLHLGDRTTTKNQIFLSQLSTGGGTGTFTFGVPPALPFSNADGIKSIGVVNAGGGYTPFSTFPVGSAEGAVRGDRRRRRWKLTARSPTSSSPVGARDTPRRRRSISAGTGNGATALAVVGTYITPLDLKFTPDQLRPRQFAGTVYAAMAAEASIPNFTVNNPLLPAP